MSGGRGSQVDDRPFDGSPDPEEVASRADGRPPEEQSSEAPKAQAEAILEDSEERVEAGAARSEPDTKTPL